MIDKTSWITVYPELLLLVMGVRAAPTITMESDMLVSPVQWWAECVKSECFT